MLISIIIPVYNVEKYLKRCLDSVLEQTYKNIEIIIVNDGSLDNSQAIIDDYCRKDSRIISIVQKNMGLGEARNTGINNAQGECCYFLDSDDYICIDAIEKLALEKEKDNKLDIIAAEFKNMKNDIEYTINEFMDIDIISSNMYSGEVLYDYFFNKAIGGSACNKLYDLSFIKKNKLKFKKNSKIFAEDLLFNLMCVVHKPKVKLINEPIYIYCFNSSSIMKLTKPYITERYINLIKIYIKYCKENKVFNEYKELICVLICVAFSNSSQEIFEYAKRSEVIMKLRKEFMKYQKEKNLKRYLRLRHLKISNKREYKYFYMLFILFYKFDLILICSVMQYIRFKITKKKRNSNEIINYC